MKGINGLNEGELKAPLKKTGGNTLYSLSKDHIETTQENIGKIWNEHQNKDSNKNAGYVNVLGAYQKIEGDFDTCLLYTSPSPRDKRQSRMPSSA